MSENMLRPCFCVLPGNAEDLVRWVTELRRIFRSTLTCTHQCIRTLHERTLSRLDIQP